VYIFVTTNDGLVNEAGYFFSGGGRPGGYIPDGR